MENFRPAVRLLPFLLLIIAIEAIVIFRRRGTFPRREMATSVLIAIGQRAINAMMAGTMLGVYLFAWNHRLFNIPTKALSLVGLFLAVEFIYYWFHRLSHECRWLWATHSVHHSATHFNLSASYRLGWTGVISGVWLFWLPLVWVGFHPTVVLSAVGLNLMYQFWLHTELIPPLGKFELIFNSPSLHRVHHSSNEEYLDKNYGGVLIIFDRLFGTYQPEKKSVTIRYGLLGVAPTLNPFRIAFHEWIEMGKDFRRSKTWKQRRVALFGRPH